MILSQFFKVAANLFTLTKDLLPARAAALEPLQISAIALKLGMVPAQLGTVTL